MDVFHRIITLLENNNISYELKEHPPTPTSEDAAKHRNEPLEIGAKALILKTYKEFVMCIVSGAKKLDSKKLKNILNTKKLRFASREEVIKVSNCIPGSVPPFGNLFSIKVFIDKSFLKNKFIAFNAGSLTKSIKMKKQDFLSLVKPEIHDFSQ